MRPLKNKIKNLFFICFLCCGALTLAACGSAKTTQVGRLESPPVAYLRHLVLVFEKETTFAPIVGARLTIETEAPTRLIQPADAVGRTGTQGEIDLIFEPYANYDDAALKVGDQVVEYPIKAKISLHLGSQVMTVDLNDEESFARYQDPLYQGLNRNPAEGETYYIISVP